jgi:hypothetical protein
MAIVSIDKTADGVAIKLGESARVSPEKLVQFLAENSGSVFSPSGILRVSVQNADPISIAQRTLEQVRL